LDFGHRKNPWIEKEPLINIYSKEMQEKHRNKGKKLYYAFVDLEKH